MSDPRRRPSSGGRGSRRIETELGRSRTRLYLPIVLILLFVNCLGRSNPLDPENEDTRGIGFNGLYHSEYATTKIRTSRMNRLYTLPGPWDRPYVAKFAVSQTDLVLEGVLETGFAITDIAFSPVDREAALISYSKLTFIDTAEMRILDELTVHNDLSDVCYSPSGDRVYVAPMDGEIIYIYSGETHASVDRITGLPRGIVDIEAHGEALYAVSQDPQVHVSVITDSDLERFDSDHSLGYVGEDKVILDPGENCLYFADDNEVYKGNLVEPLQPRAVLHLPEAVLDISLDPLGEYIYVGMKNSIALFLLDSFEPVLELIPEDELGQAFKVEGLEATTDGNNVFVNLIYPDALARLKIRF